MKKVSVIGLLCYSTGSKEGRPSSCRPHYTYFYILITFPLSFTYYFDLCKLFLNIWTTITLLLMLYYFSWPFWLHHCEVKWQKNYTEYPRIKYCFPENYQYTTIPEQYSIALGFHVHSHTKVHSLAFFFFLLSEKHRNSVCRLWSQSAYILTPNSPFSIHS